jgi:hypothetical protein
LSTVKGKENTGILKKIEATNLEANSEETESKAEESEVESVRALKEQTQGNGGSQKLATTCRWMTRCARSGMMKEMWSQRRVALRREQGEQLESNLY